MSKSPNRPVITVDRQIHLCKVDELHRDDIKPALSCDRTQENQGMTFEIVINQKNHKTSCKSLKSILVQQHF
ncbi:hypothetical protein MICAE_2420002 [Microcystis aeruginosa PCC 9806]|uniref:Uncharacterized protein n=1 Tax=Microcystis aeruginosa PCC 9806 TaxID=1160282 RepID=I4GWL3_MICAE|nr:hypothetical protein MICAE_2420002 [Microcystis aeruginosa PCC 9806]